MEIANSKHKGRIEYTYSARGAKLRTVHKDNSELRSMSIMGVSTYATSGENITTTDYVGNKVYENGTLKRTLVDGGYIEGNQYYFYLTDHLGNNRAVAKDNGEVIQKTHYYPFGMAFADATEKGGDQPYKYNGKELDRRLQLNTYDYAARYMDPAIGRFTSVDPLAEKYYSISPYAYVANNPLKYIDPTGMAYRPTKDEDGNYTGFEWVDDSESYDDDGNLKDGLFEKAILFNNNGTWSIGVKTGNRYMSYNIGSSTATVYDYDEVENEDGSFTKSPTSTDYNASTNPSDPNAFGTVAKGLMQAVRHKHQNKYWALGMRTLNGSASIPSNGVNPSNNTNVVTGANIHKAGINNATSSIYKPAEATMNTALTEYTFTPSKYTGVSQGCFLIDVNQWNSFMNHFPVGVGKIGVLNK